MFSLFKPKSKRHLRFLIHNTIQKARILEESNRCFLIKVWEPSHYRGNLWLDGSSQTFWVMKTDTRIVDVDGSTDNTSNVVSIKRVA